MILNEKEKEYFNEDCLIRDEVFNSIKQYITCPKCNNIYKNPLLCSSCSACYCEQCIEDKSKCDNCHNSNIEYRKNISKCQLLSRLKYRCNNCSNEVYQNDILAHLESNCHKKTLKEMFTTKKELKRLSMEEVEERKENEPIYSIRSN